MTAPSTTCARCQGAGWVWLTAGTADRARAVEASCPECCAPSPQAIADWRAAHRWSPQARRCRHCGAPTYLRDEDGVPAHKLCAERTVAASTVADAAPAGGAR
jgi:hypothetical protein